MCGPWAHLQLFMKSGRVKMLNIFAKQAPVCPKFQNCPHLSVLLAAVAQPQKIFRCLCWNSVSYGLLGLFLRPFTSGPVLGMLDNLLVKRPLFCTAGIPRGGGDLKVPIVQSNLVCPVTYLLECPGGSENPCNGHGTCLDGIQQNGTCICKVSAQFTPRVMCFARGSCLCGVCAGALGEGCPSAWKAICSSFRSSISVWFSCSIVVVCNSTKTLLVMAWCWEESQGWNEERIAWI